MPGIGIGLGIDHVGYSEGSAGVGTNPANLTGAVIGLTGDDSFTNASAGDHVTASVVGPINLVSGGTTVVPSNANTVHFLHRADWPPTVAAATMTMPNGHYFFSDNADGFDSAFASRWVCKHTVTTPSTSSEQTVIQVVWWANYSIAATYHRDVYDHGVQFYNYRVDNFRGDLKTPNATIQTTADMDSYPGYDQWGVLAWSFGAGDFNHWYNGKEMTVLNSETGLGGDGCPTELWIEQACCTGCAEFWYYDVKHSKLDIQSAIQYLCNKYGITYTNQPL